MSKYILYKEVWTALYRHGKQPDDQIPNVFEGDDEVAAANGVIDRYVARYKFIDRRISQALGSTAKVGSDHFWVGISPPESDHMIQDCQNYIGRFLLRCKWVKYALVFEQRETLEEFDTRQGTDISFKGFHCHCLLQSKSTYDVINRGVRNSCDGAVYKVDAIPAAWASDKVRYLQGEKNDERKLLLGAVDKIMRRQLGLMEVYFVGDWPGLPASGASAFPRAHAAPLGSEGLRKKKLKRARREDPDSSVVGPVLTEAGGTSVPYAGPYDPVANEPWHHRKFPRDPTELADVSAGY